MLVQPGGMPVNQVFIVLVSGTHVLGPELGASLPELVPLFEMGSNLKCTR